MLMNVWSRHRFCAGLIDQRGRMFLTDREPFLYQPFPDNGIWIASQGDTLDGIAGTVWAGFDGAPGLEDPSQLWWILSDGQPAPEPDWAFDPTRAVPAGARVHWFSARVLRELIFSEARRYEHEA